MDAHSESRRATRKTDRRVKGAFASRVVLVRMPL